MDGKKIAERIESRRQQLGLTLDDIAKEIGVARSTVQRYEKGVISKIKLPVIESIARELLVNPDWLCCKTDIMEDLRFIHNDKENPAPLLGDGNPSDMELLDAYRNAPDYKKDAIKDLLGLK